MTLAQAIQTVMCERCECDPHELGERDDNLIRAVVNFDPEPPDALEQLDYVLSFLNDARDLLVKAEVTRRANVEAA